MHFVLKNPDLVGQIQQGYYKMEHVESPLSHVFDIVPRYLTNGMPLRLTALESLFAIKSIERGIKLLNEQGSCFNCLWYSFPNLSNLPYSIGLTSLTNGGVTSPIEIVCVVAQIVPGYDRYRGRPSMSYHEHFIVRNSYTNVSLKHHTYVQNCA